MFNTLLDKFPITARWVWDNLPKLHPDYCRGVDRLRPIYNTEDCRVLSVLDAFNKWGMEIPEDLKTLLNEASTVGK